MPRLLTEKQVRKLARRAEQLTRPALGIGPEWRIDWDVRQPGDTECKDAAMVCCVSPEYRTATITVWPDRDPGLVPRNLVHELCHVAQWPFRAYTDLITQIMPKKQRRTDRFGWSQAAEQHVEAVLMQSAPIKAVVKQLEAEARAMTR